MFPTEHQHEATPDHPTDAPPGWERDPRTGEWLQTDAGDAESATELPPAGEQATTVPGGESGAQRDASDVPRPAVGGIGWEGNTPVFVAAENEDGSFVVGRFSSYETHYGGLTAERGEDAAA